MSNIWFTSDLHLGHKNVHRWRTEYDTSAEHDNYVIQILVDSAIKKRDTLYILGDGAFNYESLCLLHQLECRKVLVRGNHDGCTTEQQLEVFDKIEGFVSYKGMWLSHCPIHPQEMYSKHCNVHGHIHRNTNSPMLPFPYINVNWDFWKRPIAMAEIKHFIKQKKVDYEYNNDK